MKNQSIKCYFKNHKEINAIKYFNGIEMRQSP